jgi:hypothetical protein
VRHAVPFSTTATATMWGLGVNGLRAHGSIRLLTDFTGNTYWPGTEPAVQLIELYAGYQRDWFAGRAGRIIEANQLGYAGYDGVEMTAHLLRRRLTVGGYGGLGLARASLLPINSPELNPFNQFQLQDRQWILGFDAGWNSRMLDLSAEYQRQVDRATDYFIAERAAVSTVIRPVDRVSLQGNVVYDLAQDRVGMADATVNWTSPLVSAAVGYRHYRPMFQLWEIWAAFNTVPYNAATGSLWIGPWKGLRLSLRGEAYRYDDNSLPSPLVTVDDEGWRTRVGASYRYRQFDLGLGYSADTGPGAASSGWDASLAYLPSERWQVSASGGHFNRPLEYRFDESVLNYAGVEASYQVPQRMRFRIRADYYDEDRNRPDAAAFSWDQTRLSAEVSFYLSSAVKTRPLPPGRMPGATP